MQFEVETAGVAHWFPVGVATPQRRRGRVAVGAAETDAARRRLKSQRHRVKVTSGLHFRFCKKRLN